MNQEILERLLIDRAAGELPPDTTALLEDYLAGKKELAAEAAQIEETMRLAKQAMAGSRTPVLPPMRPTVKLTVIDGGKKSTQRLPYWAYGMAACFAAGLMLGLLAMRGGNLPTAVVIKTEQPAAAAVVKAPSAEPGFWSLARLQSVKHVAATKPDYQITWTSPVKRPEIKPSL